MKKEGGAFLRLGAAQRDGGVTDHTHSFHVLSYLDKYSESISFFGM